jgi:hypothetical protein
LSRPQDRWPGLFSHNFWSEYPYFLPCLAVAALALFVFATTALFFKEVGFWFLATLTRHEIDFCYQDSQTKPSAYSTIWDCWGATITGRKWNTRYIAEGRRTTRAIALPAYKASPNVYCQLRSYRAARRGRDGASPSRLVNSNKFGRIGAESGIHRIVDLRIWGFERPLSICRLPTCHRTLWPAACIHHRNRFVFRGIRPIPVGESCGSPCNRRRDGAGCMAAHRATAPVNIDLRHVVRYVSCARRYVNVFRMWTSSLQARFSCTFLRPRRIGARLAPRTVSPKRQSRSSARLDRQLRRRCSRTRWRTMSWVWEGTLLMRCCFS